MSKMSVKKVTGVMILSLSFGVSAALMSPFGGVFAGGDGENGKGTQGSSENVTVNRNSWGIFAQQALYVPLASELQSTVGNTVQTIVSEESQAPVITQNATFDDFSSDDFQVSLMNTNAIAVDADLYAQNGAAVAETPGQNFGPGPNVFYGFDNRLVDQAYNKNTKASRPRRSVKLNAAEEKFKLDIARILHSTIKTKASKDLVILYATKAIDSLAKQGIHLAPINREETRCFDLFYKHYAPYSDALLKEMNRLFTESQKTLDPFGLF